MRHVTKTVLALAIMAAMALPALSGEKGEYKCKEDTQACLNRMVAKMKNRGWLGIEMDDAGGAGAIKVTRVVPGSPAEEAGFKVGDVLVSVNGAKFAENTDQKCVTCEKTSENWAPGTKAQYVVSRSGQDVPLNVKLGAWPSDALAQMVGMHMIEHAQPLEGAPKK